MIRRAAPADAAALAALAERTFRATYASGSDTSDLEGYIAGHFSPALQAQELANSGLLTEVAVDGATLIGYIQMREGKPPPTVPGATALEVKRIYVDQAWQGRAVGSALLDRAVVRANATGATLWLVVFAHNAPALRFYEKHGFRPVGEQTFQMGSVRHLDLVLARRSTGGG